MRTIATASLALALLGATGLSAQNPAPAARPPAQAPGARPQGQPQPPAAAPGEIRGTVVDAETGQPVGSASVSVFTRGADSALVAGAIAGANGQFRIQGLRPGTYSLRVSMMGYRPQAGTAVTVADAQPRANAGTIRLAKSAIALQGVTATAERAAVSIAPDRNTYQTRTVAPAATNASEVLESVPAVQVDPDGRVSLRGNENVVVQINGRPSPMRGAQLASYLKQLPANTLERVEVIPNPSARQDPEGMAGIINIVLKQNVDLGLSGGLTLSASSEDRYSGTGNIGWQHGPATVFASYGYLNDTRHEVGVNDRTRLLAENPLSFTNQDIAGSVGNAGHNLNATLDYRLGAKNTLSSSLLVNVRGSDQETLSDYHILDSGEHPLDRYLRLRDSDTDGRMVDASLGFRRTLVPQRHELSAEVRLNRIHDLDRTDLFRQPLGGGAHTDAEIDVTDATSWQLTGQVDYTRALGQRGKLETGYKGWQRWLDRDYRVTVDPLGSGVFTPSASSNALQLDEGVHAVYAVLSGARGPWEVQGGLRGEYATRDFTLASTGERFPHDYTSLFPSGLVSYKLGEHDQVKLSYSRRVRRPGTQELNPFPVFFDLQNVFLGNPSLDPEYTDAMELGWQHSARIGSLQVSPFYRRTSNVIRFIVNTADSIAGREVTSITFQNLDHGTSWGADVNGQARLGQAFSGFAGFNVFKMVTEGGGGESSLASNAVSWSARVNGTFNLSPRTSFTAQYFYRAPMNIERGRFEGMGIANFSLRQKIYGEKAAITFRVSDPFDGTRFRVRAGDDNVIQLTERTFNARAFHVSLQYNFGRPPRARPQRPQEQPQQAPTPFGG